MKRIAVITVGRSDYGIYRPLLGRLQECPDIALSLIVAGAHLDDAQGRTISQIKADGFPIGAEVPLSYLGDGALQISTRMGTGMIEFAKTYERLKPDLLLVLGDRYEMFAAVSTAVPFQIPIGHIHGGELSLGAIDDCFRHSITKMSHLHFASTQAYAQRIIQLGEEPWRVTVSGAPGLDAILNFEPLSNDQFNQSFGSELPEKFILVTYHPATISDQSPIDAIKELVKALESFSVDVVFTMPNADAGSKGIRAEIKAVCERHSNWRAYETLGTRGYFTAMSRALAMVGNSSSGIIEAASFGLSVVNIGPRQRGRIKGANVVDAAEDSKSIINAITRVLDPEFQSKSKAVQNPYGDGDASEKIVEVLRNVPLDRRLLLKNFVDLEVSP